MRSSKSTRHYTLHVLNYTQQTIKFTLYTLRFTYCYFWLLQFQYFLAFREKKVGSLQTSLLCTVGKLAGGGSLDVVVGISDR